MSDFPSNRDFYLKYFKHVAGIENRLHTPKDVGTDDNPFAIALKQVRDSNGQVVYFQTEGNAKYNIAVYGLETDTEIKYYFSKEKFHSSFNVLYYSSHCYFSEYLNRAILQVKAMQIHDRNKYEKSTITNYINSRLNKPPPPSDMGLINLRLLSAAAMMIAVLCVTSLCCFFLEVFIK